MEKLTTFFIQLAHVQFGEVRAASQLGAQFYNEVIACEWFVLAAWSFPRQVAEAPRQMKTDCN